MYNLLPEEQQKKLHKEYQLRVTTITMFLFSGVFICGFLSLVPAITLTYLRHSSYQDELSLIQQSTKEETGKTYASTIQAVNDQVKILSLIDQERKPHKIFDSIIENRGEGIRLTKFFYEVTGSTTPVTLEGSTSRLEQLLRFQNTMQNTKPFYKADFPIELLSKPKNIEIRFTMQLK